MRKRNLISRFHWLWLAVALVAGLALTLTVMSAVALSASPEGPENAPGGIEGFLRKPDGTPSGGWVHIRDVNGQPWMGADANPVDGSFSIPNLPPGIYILRAYSPPGSPFAGSLPVEVEVLSGQWATATLYLTDVRISGYVRDCAAIPEKPIEGATVAAHRTGFLVWDSTNISGEFKLGGMNVGVSYTLEALPPPGSEYVSPEPKTVVPISNSVILEMCIPPTNVVGIVHHPDGYPLNDAWAVLWNDSYWNETATDVSGTFTFRGVPPGEFWLHVGPPWGPQGAGLIAIDPFTITIAQPDTLVDVGVLTLQQAFKTVHGRVVVAGTNIGVPEAEVHARQLDGSAYAGAPTDQTGVFTLSLTGGEWHLGVEPLRPPVPWIFPGPPAWVFFAQDASPETRAVNLEVIPTNATVTGRVICPDYNEVLDIPCPSGPPHDAIWVELRSDDIRNDAGLGPDYRFEIPIPDGPYELVVRVGHPELQGPEPIPVVVGPGAAYDVGDVKLLLKDARITGRVTNEFGSGVAGVAVAGWQPEGVGRSWAETDASGFYTMPIIGGEWFVEPRPEPDLPFVFRYHPRVVFVAPHGEMRGVDFELSWADARIQGFAVDARDDHRLWGLDGWTRAERPVAPDKAEFFSDAPMRDSAFDLKVRGGYTYYVGLDLPPHAPYVSGGADPLPVAPGEWLTDVVVRLEPKDAAIEGTLFVITGTPPAPAPARGVWAKVFGEDEHGHWAVAGVDPDSARYELGVVSGTWHLRAWVDPASGYAAPPTVTVVTAHSGPVPTIQDFEVWAIASSISGRVLQPNGSPLSKTLVFAKGKSPFVGYFETHAESDADGFYELRVPEGGYVVGAALPGDELAAHDPPWLNPRPVDVPHVSAGSPATGIDFRFREMDGEIHGTVTFAPGIVATPTHPAYVWGWTDTGEWAETAAMTSSVNTFTYTLRVVSDTVWHVGAVYEDRENGVFYESPERTVPVLPPGGQAIQDLKLGGPWPLPQPFIVSFDGTYMQTIVMPDGVELHIPPGALVDSGTVTLFIFPTQEMRPEPGREIIGAGYKIWAIDQNGKEITQFKKNVVMTFSYPPDHKLPPGISEHMLVPVYYSTLVGHWTLADSYVVDTVHNEITLQLAHFSKFGVMSTGPADKRVYLPLVLKSLGG